MEDLFDKDTTKKYEAFLAELERERKKNINKGCDNVKKKHDNLKKKKNKKIFRKAEEPKVLISASYSDFSYSMSKCCTHL